MPSSYSTNLKIELQATGENSGTWGTITNTNLGTALEQAVVGYGNPSYPSDANLTLTYTDTNAAQAARALVLNVTSAVSLSATRELVVPTIQKQYIVQNNTSGSQSITVKTSAGTGITVPNGRKAHLYVNGTDVIFMDDYVDINGGSIDGTTIGANSAAAGNFTTVDTTNIEVTNLKAKDGTAAGSIADSTGVVTLGSSVLTTTDINGGTIDGTTIGGSSAAAGTFTTLTTSSTVTLNGGTANGVLYLNGSKVATSGTALTFDGTILTSNTGAFTTLGVISSASTAAFSSYVRPANNKNIYFREATAVGGSLTGALIQGATNDAAGWAALSFGATEYEWGISGTERMRLDSSGNLGIGTTSPSSRLSIVTPTSDATVGFNLRAYTTGADGDRTVSSRYTSSSDGNWANSKYQAWAHIWETNGTEKLRLDSSGNLGIGTASPTGRLHITTASGNTDFVHNVTGAGTAARTVYQRGGSVQFYAGLGAWSGTDTYQIAGASGPLTTIDSSGNLGIGTASPAAGYKLDVNGSIIGLGTNTASSGSGGQLRFRDDTGTFRWLVGMSGAAGTSFLFYDNVASSTRLTIDSSGNLGLGVTPSAWGSGWTASQVRNSHFANISNNYTSIGYNAYESSGWKYINNGHALLYQQNSVSGQHSWSTAASGTAGNAISFTQTMTLDASGNLALGRTTATELGVNIRTVDMDGTSGAGLRLRVNGTSTGYFYATASALYLSAPANIPTVFETNNTERARITSGGDLLVGTTSIGLSRKFGVESSGDVAVFKTTGSATTTPGEFWNTATSGDNRFIFFYTEANATARGSITYNRAGGLVAYNTTSDYRAKDILGPVQNSGATIDALKVYEGQMKGATQSRPMLVAHEAQEHAPYTVTGEKDAVNEDGTPNYQQMDVSALVPLLLAELQSLRKRVAELETK